MAHSKLLLHILFVVKRLEFAADTTRFLQLIIIDAGVILGFFLHFCFPVLLHLLLWRPNLAALEVDMLSDQARAHCLSEQGWVLANVRLTHEQTILRHAIHDHVFELYVAHIALFVQSTKLRECLHRRHCPSLTLQSLVLHWIRQRILFAAVQFLFAFTAPIFRDIIVVEVWVESSINDALGFAF